MGLRILALVGGFPVFRHWLKESAGRCDAQTSLAQATKPVLAYRAGVEFGIQPKVDVTDACFRCRRKIDFVPAVWTCRGSRRQDHCLHRNDLVIDCSARCRGTRRDKERP